MRKNTPTIIPGTRYGNLVTTGIYVPGHFDDNKNIHGKIECKCDCGSITYKELGNLKDIRYKNKVCSRKCEYYSSVKHNLSRDENGKQRKEYNAWNSMKDSCDNPKSRNYKYIGQRGITYHESFSTIEGWWEDLGEAPSDNHRFGRIDKTGNFEPGNVHWYLADGKKK